MKITWRELNRIINHKTEDELHAMIVHEFDTHKRVTILEKLHQRFTMLRAKREREQLIGVRRDETIM